jgi:hypothetical protein
MSSVFLYQPFMPFQAVVMYRQLQLLRFGTIVVSLVVEVAMRDRIE